MVVVGIIDHLTLLLQKAVKQVKLPQTLGAISSIATIERPVAKGKFGISALGIASKMFEVNPIDTTSSFRGNSSNIEWYHLLKGQKMIVACEGPRVILCVGGSNTMGAKKLHFDDSDGERLYHGRDSD